MRSRIRVGEGVAGRQSGLHIAAREAHRTSIRTCRVPEGIFDGYRKGLSYTGSGIRNPWTTNDPAVDDGTTEIPVRVMLTAPLLSSTVRE